MTIGQWWVGKLILSDKVVILFLHLIIKVARQNKPISLLDYHFEHLLRSL